MNVEIALYKSQHSFFIVCWIYCICPFKSFFTLLYTPRKLSCMDSIKGLFYLWGLSGLSQWWSLLSRSRSQNEKKARSKYLISVSSLNHCFQLSPPPKKKSLSFKVAFVYDSLPLNSLVNASISCPFYPSGNPTFNEISFEVPQYSSLTLINSLFVRTKLS